MPRKILKRSKSCSFILSEPNKSNMKVDFSNPLKTSRTLKNDLSSLKNVENKNNFKTTISENIESCYNDKPINSIPQRFDKIMDFPSCSSGVVESKTNKVEYKASLNKCEEELYQRLLDIKGLFKYY